MTIKEVDSNEIKPNSREKILSYSQAAEKIRRAREAGKVVVHASGVFDVMHMGHVDFLRAAKSAGDILVVGIEPDENVKMNKGEKRPFNDTQKRADFLAEIGCVDYVFAFEDKVVYSKSRDEYSKRVRKLNPDFIAVSTAEDNLNIKMKTIQEEGVDIVLVSHHRTDSTTHILRLMGYESPSKLN